MKKIAFVYQCFVNFADLMKGFLSAWLPTLWKGWLMMNFLRMLLSELMSTPTSTSLSSNLTGLWSMISSNFWYWSFFLPTFFLKISQLPCKRFKKRGCHSDVMVKTYLIHKKYIYSSRHYEMGIQDLFSKCLFRKMFCLSFGSGRVSSW